MTFLNAALDSKEVNKRVCGSESENPVNYYAAAITSLVVGIIAFSIGGCSSGGRVALLGIGGASTTVSLLCGARGYYISQQYLKKHAESRSE